MRIKKEETFEEAINTTENGIKKKSNKKLTKIDPAKKLKEEDKEYRDKINNFMLTHVFYDSRYAGRVPLLFYSRLEGALKEYRYVKGSVRDKKDIYTYKQFYIACALSVQSIDYAMANVQFEDTAHIINYIMKIVRNQLVVVGDMKTFEEIKEKTNEELKKSLDDDSKRVYNPEDKYIRKTSEEDEYLEEFI